jgi:CRISPR/Cas system-associated exonuclease Cas4 (RecB family)
MSRTIIIPSSSDLIDAVLSHLELDGLNYSGNIVVFPGKRPVHFLRKAIGKHVGKSFIPPRAYSIDRFIDFIYEEKLGRKEKEVRPLDAAALLHEIYEGSPHRIAEGSFDKLDLFLPLGMRLFEEFEELTIANLSPETLSQVIDGLTIGGSLSLAVMYRAFYEEVEKRQFTTRSLKYVESSAGWSPEHFAPYRKIVFGGFFALTDSESSLFRKFASIENVVFVFQQGRGLEQRLRTLGVEAEAQTEMSFNPKIHYYQSADSHGQVFALTKKLQEHKDRDLPLDQRTVIVLPASESLLPVVHQSLTLLPDESYNISLGYPATRTPVYGFLSTLMDLVSSMCGGDLYAPDYVKFVLHPYTKNILLDHRTDATRIMFHAIEEHLAKRKARTFFPLDYLETGSELLGEISRRLSSVAGEYTAQRVADHLRSIHDNTIRKVLGAKTVGEFASRCIDVLAYIDAHSTARRHLLFRPYVESLIESLDVITTSLLANKKVEKVEQAFNIIRGSLAEAQIPFPGTPLRGLQILGFLETRSLKFDKLYILDASDDTLPGSGKRHAIIPQKVREHFGLPTYHQQEEIAAYYFGILLSGAKEAHLFFTENRTKEKSRFVQQLLWEQQKSERRENPDEYVQSVRYGVRLANNTPGGIKKTEEVIAYLKKFTYHATALDVYLRCQLKFYYQYVLGLREREEVADDIDRMDIGILVHKVLRLYFKDKLRRPLTETDLNLDGMASIVEKEFTTAFGGDATGGKYLLKRQIQKQMRRFVTNYQIPMSRQSPLTIEWVELKIPEFVKEGYRLKGDLDRVEKRNGKVFILDFKTGSDEKRFSVDFSKLVADDPTTWSEAVGSLQLPLYAMLYAGQFREDIENVVQVTPKIESRLFTESDSPREKYGVLEDMLSRMLDKITSPDKPFEPTKELDKNCPSCPYKQICGTQWVQGWSIF